MKHLKTCACFVVDHELVYCPLHASAEEMREALKATRYFLDEHPELKDNKPKFVVLVEQAFNHAKGRT